MKTFEQVISWYGFVVGDQLPPSLLCESYKALVGEPKLDEEIETLLALLGLNVQAVGTHFMIVRGDTFVGSIDTGSPVSVWRLYLTQLADKFAGVAGCDR